MTVSDLPAVWVHDARALGAGGDVAGAGARLLAHWAEPHRGYHDLRHLDEVLERIDTLAPYAVDLPVVRLAGWFHDAVYDPAAEDNEARSAAYAEDVLTAMRVDPAAVAEVARLVHLTAAHDAADGDPDGAVLCDADLAVLASPPDRYADYVAGVRREYAHLDDAAFAAGRRGVLGSLATRPRLFRTEHAQVQWEAAARANLSAELSRLGDA